jgi:hypothetical protein
VREGEKQGMRIERKGWEEEGGHFREQTFRAWNEMY